MKEIWNVVDSREFANGRLVNFTSFKECRDNYMIEVYPTAFYLSVEINHHGQIYKKWSDLSGHDAIEIVEKFRLGEYDKQKVENEPHLEWFAPSIKC